MAAAPVSPISPAPQTFTSPDHYQLSGGGISITYLPIGVGALSRLQYQDALRTLEFSGDQVRKVDVPDLGTIVSVTLNLTVDSGSTTFSVLIPQTTLLAAPGSSAHIHTDGITTVHRFSVMPGALVGQDEFYTVTHLSGTASNILIPL